MDSKQPLRGSLEDGLLEFLSEIRDEVCSRCSGQPVGDPRGNPCGAELSLGQLVNSLRIAAESRETAEPPEQAVSEFHCPAAPECLAALAREAAAEMERRRRRRARLIET